MGEVHLIKISVSGGVLVVGRLVVRIDLSKLVGKDGGRYVSLDHVKLAERALKVSGGAFDGTAEWLKGSGVSGFLSHGRLEW